MNERFSSAKAVEKSGDYQWDRNEKNSEKCKEVMDRRLYMALCGGKCISNPWLSYIERWVIMKATYPTRETATSTLSLTVTDSSETAEDAPPTPTPESTPIPIPGPLPTPQSEPTTLLRFFIGSYKYIC